MCSDISTISNASKRLSPLFRCDFHKVELPCSPNSGNSSNSNWSDQSSPLLIFLSLFFFLQKPDLKFIFNLVKYTQSCKCDLKNPLVSNSDIRDADGLYSRSLFASFATNRKLLLNLWRVNILALWHQWKLFRRVFSFLKNWFFF